MDPPQCWTFALLHSNWVVQILISWEKERWSNLTFARRKKITKPLYVDIENFTFSRKWKINRKIDNAMSEMKRQIISINLFNFCITLRGL